MPAPGELCAHHFFEAQVARTPDAVAVFYKDERLDYAELNRRANRLAHYLRRLGIVPGDRVAICLERRLELIVAVLAVFKAGAAYVPLDPAYPAARPDRHDRGLLASCRPDPVRPGRCAPRSPRRAARGRAAREPGGRCTGLAGLPPPQPGSGRGEPVARTSGLRALHLRLYR